MGRDEACNSSLYWESKALSKILSTQKCSVNDNVYSNNNNEIKCLIAIDIII